jgi:hypothetical protein
MPQCATETGNMAHMLQCGDICYGADMTGHASLPTTAAPFSDRELMLLGSYSRAAHRVCVSALLAAQPLLANVRYADADAFIEKLRTI